MSKIKDISKSFSDEDIRKLEEVSKDIFYLPNEGEKSDATGHLPSYFKVQHIQDIEIKVPKNWIGEIHCK